MERTGYANSSLDNLCGRHADGIADDVADDIDFADDIADDIVDDIGHLQCCPQRDLVRYHAGSCSQITYVVCMSSARHPQRRPHTSA